MTADTEVGVTADEARDVDAPIPPVPVVETGAAGEVLAAADEAVDQAPTGMTIWLTGLPSAGKTTLARAAADELAGSGRRVQVLDGDEIRTYLSAGLGFSRADRDANVRRIGYVARLLASHGVTVFAPVIAPYAATRDEVRALHDEVGIPYLEVHVAAPVEVCAERDVKGLYARQRAGEIEHLTGVDDPYEEPQRPDLRVDTATLSLAEATRLLVTTVGGSS
jgi:adenylylsulfate kinase